MARIVLGISLLLTFGQLCAEEVRVCDRDALLDLDCGSFVKHIPKQTRVIDSIYYDAQNQYLVFRMNGTYYHRCGVPQEVIESWVNASNTVNHYQRTVKPRYTCAGEVPSYTDTASG